MSMRHPKGTTEEEEEDEWGTVFNSESQDESQVDTREFAHWARALQFGDVPAGSWTAMHTHEGLCWTPCACVILNRRGTL